MSKLRIINNTDNNKPPERRAIGLLGGRIEQNLDEIEEALLEQRIGIFQRNGALVLPGTVSIEVRDGEIIEAAGLVEVFCRIFGRDHHQRRDARQIRCTLKKGGTDQLPPADRRRVGDCVR